MISDDYKDIFDETVFNAHNLMPVGTSVSAEEDYIPYIDFRDAQTKDGHRSGRYRIDSDNLNLNDVKVWLLSATRMKNALISE